MQSQPEHSITLPLINEKDENIYLPLVIKVVTKYWGEEIPLETEIEMAKKYSGMKGSGIMEGI